MEKKLERREVGLKAKLQRLKSQRKALKQDMKKVKNELKDLKNSKVNSPLDENVVDDGDSNHENN